MLYGRIWRKVKNILEELESTLEVAKTWIFLKIIEREGQIWEVLIEFRGKG